MCMNKQAILFLSCFLGVTGSLFAQELSIKFDEKGKAGYVDASGAIVVQCKYDAAFDFVNGLGRVMKGDKFGLVDKTGTEVVPVKWEELTYDAKHDLYRVKSGKKCGILDGKGKELLKAQYSYISEFNCYGKALLAIGGKPTPNQQQKGKSYLLGAKYGVLNADGTVAIEAKWKGFYEFTQVAVPNTVGTGIQLERRIYNMGDTLKSDCKYVGYDSKGWSTLNAGVMDEKGNIVIKPKMAQFVFLPHNGMARYYNYSKKTNFEVGYINLANQVKTKLVTNVNNYTVATDFMESVAAVAQNGVWNFVDKNMNKVHGGYKTLAKGTTCNMWCAWRTDGVCEFFDTDGKPMLEGTNYTEVFFPRNNKGTDFEYISVKKDGMWGMIDKNNNVKIPFEYDKVNDSRYGWVPVKKNGKWGMHTLDEQEIVPTEYEDITSVVVPNAKALYVKKSDKLWYVFNTEQKKEVTKGYRAGGGFVEGMAWVRPDNMKITDNSVYRALDNGKSVNTENFGIVIDDEGNELVSVPIPTYRIDFVRNEIKKHGKRPLTKSETKNLLLYLSIRNRHYPMDSKIDESNWDF